MTIKELQMQIPNLVLPKEIDENLIPLIPIGKRGWAEFPVTETLAIETLVGGENTTQEVTKFKDDVVFIEQKDFEGLMIGTHAWQDNKIVPYTKSQEVLNAEKSMSKAQELQKQINEAKQWLFEHDYVGVKIAEAFLVGTDEELVALKTEYADIIKQANAQRVLINECENKLATLDMKHAQEVLENEK